MDSKGLGTSRRTRWRDFELLRWTRVQTYSKRNMSLTSRLLPVYVLYIYIYVNVKGYVYIYIYSICILHDCVCNMFVCSS